MQEKEYFKDEVTNKNRIFLLELYGQTYFTVCSKRVRGVSTFPYSSVILIM